MSLDTTATPRQPGRLLGLLALLAVFDLVAVAAVYLLGHVLVAILAATQLQPRTAAMILQFDIVPLDLFVAVGTPVALVAQSVFGYRSTLRDVETVDTDATEPRLDDVRSRVAKLAHTAEMAPPEVELIDSATPNSFVASRPGERTLFVTRGLLARLDGDELDAVLAHELAHLDNGDSVVMTAAAFLPIQTKRCVRSFLSDASGTPITRRLRGEDADWNLKTALQSYHALRVLLFTLVALPVAAAVYLSSTACYRLLSRLREYAADAGAVAICGSPAAMAGALETLTDDDRPQADMRTAETGVRELCVLPYPIDGAGAAESTPDDPDRFDRIAAAWHALCRRVLPNSHPEPDARIAELRARQSALDRPADD